ncbi:uncharacterized protein LOC132286459 isoform X2 [Cornus florida]|nr:uncharacterized protein LOC132286459 isoform X2 [Cornus florida]
MMKPNLETGIIGDDGELVKRRIAFRLNTYRVKKAEFLEVPLGSLARFNTCYLDGSCSSIITTRNKDSGAWKMRIKNLHGVECTEAFSVSIILGWWRDRGFWVSHGKSYPSLG